jgi:hypothetical protein
MGSKKFNFESATTLTGEDWNNIAVRIRNWSNQLIDAGLTQNGACLLLNSSMLLIWPRN